MSRFAYAVHMQYTQSNASNRDTEEIAMSNYLAEAHTDWHAAFGANNTACPLDCLAGVDYDDEAEAAWDSMTPEERSDYRDAEIERKDQARAAYAVAVAAGDPWAIDPDALLPEIVEAAAPVTSGIPFADGIPF